MNPILALIIANVVWGAASPIFKFALTNIPPFTLAFIRFFLAGLIFLPLALRHWKKLNLKEWTEMILVGFFGITINVIFFFFGLKYTESINAPIISSAGPILIYFLSIIFLKEKPKLKVFTGMLAALAGVLIIVTSPILLDGKRFILGQVTGNLFLLVATFGAVLQTVIGRNLMKKINVFQASAVTFLFGALTFLPFSISEMKSWDISFLNINGAIGIVFGVVFSSAIAYTLFYYGLSKVKSQDAGLFTYIDPVAAVIVAYPLLHELPNAYYLAGSFLVFAGIYFAEGRIHWHPIHKIRQSNAKS